MSQRASNGLSAPRDDIVLLAARGGISEPVTRDEALGFDEDYALAGDVLGNDISAIEGMTTELVSSPQHGDLTLHADGSFSHVLRANYFGPARFSYRVADAKGRASNTVTPSPGYLDGTKLAAFSLTSREASGVEGERAALFYVYWLPFPPWKPSGQGPPIAVHTAGFKGELVNLPSGPRYASSNPSSFPKRSAKSLSDKASRHP